MSDVKMPAKLGRYEVVRELGKGAMGVVYEGKDPNIGRRVAIKTARREVVEASGMADEMMERFLREAQAAGALNHPNIITIYDAAEENGIAYIAMEYLEGGDLGEIMDSKKRLGMDEIVEIGACICEALDVAHTHGVVHRDIKPANILMPTGKPLKVADFGIAHVSDSNLTQDGALIGTPHYMSPEQFMGQKLDGRSDLFSVGNIVYELTTGEKPFAGEALSAVMHKIIKTDPVNPVELNVAMPDALGQVIMKALSKRPNQRYKTGNDMAAALRESIKENPDPAILDPGTAIALGATITGGATDTLGATVAAQAPSQDMLATVAGGAAGASATVVGGPPPSATMPGGAPAPAPGDTMEPAKPESPEAAEPAKKKHMLLGGAAAAVVVAVIGGIIYASGFNKNTPEGGDPASEAAAASVAPASSYYTGALFDIWRAQNMEDYKNYDRGTVTLDDLSGRLDEVAGNVRIELVDPDGNVVIDIPNWSAGDWIEIDPKLRARGLSYRAHVPTPTSDNSAEISIWRGEIPAPTEPEATANVDILLAPLDSGQTG